MKLPDPYPVRPWTRPCSGSVRVPGSKSLTNRALILAALSDRTIRLEGALFSRDSALLASSLRALGFDVKENAARSEVTVRGEGGRIPKKEAELFVGNAGTAARFLTAFVCLHPSGSYCFDGDIEMRERPMGGLIKALEALGARFTFFDKPGHFPFRVETSGLRAGDWFVEAKASSQMLSALMMVAPFAGGEVCLRGTDVRPAFVEMTARLMQQFGGQLSGGPSTGYTIEPLSSYSPANEVYFIEPDMTAASYFMALPLVVGGSLLIEGLPMQSLQGDVAFAEVLVSMGLQLAKSAEGWLVSSSGVIDVGAKTFSFECFSDTFLTLAAIAPLLPFAVRITDIGHTRHQETDRIAAMVKGLRSAGARVIEEEHGLEVFPFPDSSERSVVAIETFKDHRIAMAFALLGCHDRFGDAMTWIEICDPACCGKTFPEYFDRLEELYLKSHDKN